MRIEEAAPVNTAGWEPGTVTAPAGNSADPSPPPPWKNIRPRSFNS